VGYIKVTSHRQAPVKIGLVVTVSQKMNLSIGLQIISRRCSDC